MKNCRLEHILLAAALATIAGVASANVAPDVFVKYYDGNDCSGEFGQGFENCKTPAEYGSSPIIAKYNFGGAWEYNTTLFPSIGGGEFILTYNGDNSAGTWTYTPGANDPVVTYYVAKAGNGFNLFQNAGPVNSGNWNTPDGKTLSHISFYDTAASSSSGGASGNVPEPSASSLALLGMALLGATLWRRRRSDGA